MNPFPWCLFSAGPSSFWPTWWMRPASAQSWPNTRVIPFLMMIEPPLLALMTTLPCSDEAELKHRPTGLTPLHYLNALLSPLPDSLSKPSRLKDHLTGRLPLHHREPTKGDPLRSRTHSCNQFQVSSLHHALHHVSLS
jgi:hypothetical protein